MMDDNKNHPLSNKVISKYLENNKYFKTEERMLIRANEFESEIKKSGLSDDTYQHHHILKNKYPDLYDYCQGLGRVESKKVNNIISQGYITRYSPSVNPMIRTDNDSSNNERHYNPTFEESKLLKERQWFVWREEYLEAKEIILGMVFVPNEDNIAKMRIRLKLMGNNELYSRGIVDDEGNIHYNVRKSEIEFLMIRLQEVLDSRLEFVQTTWDKIQSAEDWYQLPVLYVGTQRNPKIPRKPVKPKGPEPRYILM